MRTPHPTIALSPPQQGKEDRITLPIPPDARSSELLTGGHVTRTVEAVLFFLKNGLDNGVHFNKPLKLNG